MYQYIFMTIKINDLNVTLYLLVKPHTYKVNVNTILSLTSLATYRSRLHPHLKTIL